MSQRLGLTARIAGLGLAAMLFAPPAMAQKDFNNYCTSGSFMVCASVHLSTYQEGSTWKLKMRVWNLGDLLGLAYRLTAIGLYHDGGTAWKAPKNMPALDSVMWNGKDYKSTWKSGTSGGGLGSGIELIADPLNGAGITGCGPQLVGAGNMAFSTCAPNSSVDFYISTGTQFVLDDYAQARWHAQAVDGNEDISLKCDTGSKGGSDPTGSFPPCSVVPEPVTIALLGSGLAGLGGFGFLRRRKKHGFDVENG